MRFFILVFLFGIQSLSAQIQDKPKIAFSFDDGSTADMPGYSFEQWNELLLSTIRKYQLETVLFSKGENKTTPKGKQLLESWDNAGQLIGNHTFSHTNFNHPAISLAQFETDFLRNDSIIRGYKHFYPRFRFPYLKEGNTPEKINGFRTFLNQQGYSNGHVSIDASDWYINDRLIQRLKQHHQASIEGYKNYYIQHLYNRAMYYDSLAIEVSGERIHHVLLLHHNLAAALFLDDLIDYFKSKGWEITSISEAYKDPFYQQVTTTIPAGESLVWSLAKQSGRLDKYLRYPAEDGDYEKAAMDSLGL